jgi:hypothetical protein
MYRSDGTTLRRIMYDSVTATDIPTDAEMVAGYIDGRYKWSDADWALFPHATKVTIATSSATQGANVYDVETQDLTPDEVPMVLTRERVAGRDPSVYVNRENLPAVKAALRRELVSEPCYWLATLDGKILWLPNVFAVQFLRDPDSGGHYDKSVVQDFWPGIDQPLEEEMLILTVGGSAAKWLLIGGALVDIDSSQTLQGLTDAGIKTATVTPTFIDELKAGPRAL